MTRTTATRRVLPLAATALVLLALAAVPLVRGRDVASAATLTYEAESGALTGVTVDKSASGFSGTGFVTGFDAAADSVTITIPNSPAGLVDLRIAYRAAGGQKVTTVLVNGTGLGEVTLPASTGFTSVAAGKALLRAGTNTVTIVSNWGWYDIDAITVTPTAVAAVHQVSGALANPNASDEAKSLMRYLVAHQGKDLISGQQDYSSVTWLGQNVGKLPAIFGADMIEYSPSRVAHGSVSKEVENAIDWDKRGGMVNFVWHWNAPSGLIDQPGKEWWRGFYTDSVTFDLAAAMANPNSADYKLLVRDIDTIAVQLKRLQDAHVPVVWRPLHEADGGWFWWGAKGPGPAKALYRLMYDRLTNYHKINNLVWVWNSVSPDWYPGDDVVDILSYDSYPPAGDHGPVSTQYDKLIALGKDRKPVALAEVGTVPDPALTRAYRTDWSYFVTWTGSFITDGQANSLAFLKKVYTDPNVITLDKLGDFKHVTGGPPPSPPASASPSASASPTVKPSASASPTVKPSASMSPTVSASPSAPPKPGGCRASYAIVGSWPGGFQGEVTVSNPGTASLKGWTVTWTFANGQTTPQAWNATLTTRGSTVSAANLAWNGALAAGGTATFGFIGTTTGSANPVPAPACAAL